MLGAGKPARNGVWDRALVEKRDVDIEENGPPRLAEGDPFRTTPGARRLENSEGETSRPPSV